MASLNKFITILIALYLLGSPETTRIELINTGTIVLGKELTGPEILFRVNDGNSDIAIFSTSTRRLTRISHTSTKEVYIPHLIGNQVVPSDLFFDKKGNIWLISPEDNLEISWLITGQIVTKYMDADSIMYKKINNSKFEVGLYGNCFVGNACMKLIWDHKTVDFARFPKVFSKVGFIRNSPIAADKNSVFIAQYYSGVISRYDLNGMLIYAIPTIRPIKHTPNRIVIHRERKSLFGTSKKTTYITQYKDATNAIIDIDVNNSLLITLFSGTKKKTGRYIDFYNKNNGQLVESIDLDTLIESNVFGLEVINERIFLLSQDLDHRFIISEYTILIQ